ncbi:hypothetical protein ACHAQJ_006536 [Trichoderma viride]
MSSWVVVGSARGIGFEYVNQLSADAHNTVFALIRSQNTAGPLNELAASRKNIYVLQTDISSPAKLKETAEKIGKITGGKLDVLIHNAFFLGPAATLSPSEFAGKEADLENDLIESIKVNVLHVIYTINALLPLIREGTQKKIIYISSPTGDIEVNRVGEMTNAVGYSTSKAAGGVVMAKYAGELKRDGILALSISPGHVDTDSAKEVAKSPELSQAVLSAMQKVEPAARGMISPKESVEAMLSVIKDLDGNNSGKMLSHKGNLSWF